jgi:hypothetical protein
MGNFGDVRNRRGEGPVRISRINRGMEALEGDKMECYCAIQRSVNAHVEQWTEDGVAYWKTFLEILISAACEPAPSARPYTPLPTILKDSSVGITIYNSFKETFCNKGCKCDLDLGGGSTLPRSITCIKSMLQIDTNFITGAATPKPLPEWASLLVGLDGPQDWEGVVAHSIAKEQGGQAIYPPSPRKEKDELGMGPYDESGHPLCSSLEGKECCDSHASQLGKETSLD